MGAQQDADILYHGHSRRSCNDWAAYAQTVAHRRTHAETAEITHTAHRRRIAGARLPRLTHDISPMFAGWLDVHVRHGSLGYSQREKAENRGLMTISYLKGQENGVSAGGMGELQWWLLTPFALGFGGRGRAVTTVTNVTG